MQSIIIHVKGEVQGVSFRQNTKAKATALGIEGSVQNLQDGSVEIRCTGTHEQLKSLIEWCRDGPPNATVASLDWKEDNKQSFNGFTIIR